MKRDNKPISNLANLELQEGSYGRIIPISISYKRIIRKVNNNDNYYISDYYSLLYNSDEQISIYNNSTFFTNTIEYKSFYQEDTHL